jgi:hypothetical protein
MISPLLAKATQLTARNAVRSESKEGADSIETITISPFGTELKESFDELGANLSGTFGRERAGLILAAVPIDQLFGSFGMNEVIIRRKEETVGQGTMQHSQRLYEILEIDPASRQVVASRGAGDYDFRREYSKVFDSNMSILDPQEDPH